MPLTSPVVNKPSQTTASVHSLRLQALMEEQRRREMGERIKGLRERSPLTQENVADLLGVRVRTYQRYEARGTTQWETAEQLGEIFEVSARYIWDGEAGGTGPVPDLSERLAALETKVDQLLKKLAE